MKSYCIVAVTVGFLVGIIPAVFAEGTPEEKSILLDAPELSPIELLKAARDAQINWDYSLALDYLEAAKAIAENIEIAEKTSELSKDYLKNSRLIIEKMKQAELENLFNDECIAQFKSRSVSLDKVPEKTALFYPLMFPDKSQKLLNDDFLEEDVVGTFQTNEFRIVHMATHGEFGHDPDDSYLLTYDSKLNFDKLESLIKVSKFRDKPVELLTLSACRTAVGDEQAALGLA